MPDRADVRFFPPALVAGSALVGFALHRAAPARVLPRRTARVVGACLIAPALAIAFGAVREMRNAHTSIDVREPTTALVTSGVFAYTRNPLYLSMMLLYLGIASLRNSVWLWLLAAPTAAALQAGVIDREEAYLERKFGADYVAYKRRVRRWL